MMASSKVSPGMDLGRLLLGFAQGPVPDLTVTGISANSRDIRPGNLFVAQPGISRHAIDFASDAVKAGAVAVLFDPDDDYVCQRLPLLQKQTNTHWIAVPHIQQMTGRIASRYYAEPSESMQLVGITGTDGKTSVTHLVVQALNSLGQQVGSVGTLGYGVANRLEMTRFTTPDAISLQQILYELKQKKCTYVVMEVSSHALEQYRVNGCDFDLAVLTNLGSDHLDYHGEQALYARAKAKLFARGELKQRILNGCDDFGRELYAAHCSNKAVLYARDSGCLEQQASVQLVDAEFTSQGICVEVQLRAELVRVQSGLIGSFNVDNLLACIAVLDGLGFSVADIEKGMTGLKPIPGRMEYYPAQQGHAAVVIDFAHTEQALEACLHSLKDSCHGNLLCVFGCGGDRDQGKRPRMAAVAEQLCSKVILTDDNPRNESSADIIRDILQGFARPQLVTVLPDRYQAIQHAINTAGVNDLVVIAGKGHEQFQLVAGERIPFSDRHVVKQFLEVARV